MNKIDSLQALNALIIPQLKHGLVTNAPLSVAPYKADVQAGNLYTETFSDALLILSRREGFDRLRFYLQQGATLSAYRPQNTTVTEIPYNQKYQALKNSQLLFERIGFTQLLERRRLTLNQRSLPFTCPYPIQNAKRSQLPQIAQLLREGFPPLTGCLPTERELLTAIEKGEVLVAMHDQTIAGILHLCRTPRATEYRHVLTAPNYRNRGVMQGLIAFDVNRASTPCYQLWVAADNQAALSLYQKLGFASDGWHSTVWLYQPT